MAAPSQMTGVVLKPVETRADWDRFVDFAWDIYKDDPVWVPPLRIAVRDLLDVTKNPFFRHAVMHPLLAYRDGRCVGRVVGVIDERHNEFHEEKTAFFGFFESIDDQAVADALLGEVARWAASKGMKMLRGPANPSSNHEWGLLIEGFDDPAFVMMTYNPPYYAKLLEKWGLSKSKDLLAYTIHHERSKFQEKLYAQVERIKHRGNITLRTVDMSKFDQEVETILEIYNDAWEKNWGFVPMDEAEFRHMAKDMKLIVDPEMLLIAEVKGKPVGFGLALPDVNQVFHKIRDGKLLPTGLFKLLCHLKGPFRRKTITRARVVTLGIKKAYVELGIGPVLYTEYIKRGPARGYPLGEASWILEDNVPMNKALERMCGERSKVYRLYDKAIG